MVHTKSKTDLMPVAMTTIAPLYHKFPLKHHLCHFENLYDKGMCRFILFVTAV